VGATRSPNVGKDHLSEAIVIEGVRRFSRRPSFARARVHTRRRTTLYREASRSRLFWRQARTSCSARTTTVEWALPHAKWFVGATLNVTESCLDRHLTTATKNKAAIIWEGEQGGTRTLTYAQLHREVMLLADALKGLGIEKGDRVAIYMGMVPEAAVAMLACARLGAVHTVVFGGFAADALRDRIQDSQAKLVITQDGAYRRGQIVPLKETVDRALAQPQAKSVTKTIVYRHLRELRT
jgi:acetyl-CoA synthetase